MKLQESNDAQQTTLLSVSVDVLNGDEQDELQEFVEGDLTTRLLSFAFSQHENSQTVHAGIVKILKEFDAMNTNANDQLSRRNALKRIAILPSMALGLSFPAVTIPSTKYATFLARCTASIEACWQLSRSIDAKDLALAYRCAANYISLLTPILENSLFHRQEAAEVATQYALLKTILGWHCTGLSETVQYAKEAVELSQVSGNVSLVLSAYSKLAWAYFYDKKYKSALLTAQEAQFLLEETKTPLPGCIQGGTYSTLALMQVKNHVDTSAALGKVSEIDPGNEVHAFMEFTREDVPRETALVHVYGGDSVQAQKALETLMNPDTLESKVQSSERGRIEICNTMTLALLKGKDRDMEKAILLWTTAAQEARALQSEWGFNEVVSTYDLIDVAWPGETRIKNLQDLIVHW
jgi:hypothetical protein